GFVHLSAVDVAQLDEGVPRPGFREVARRGIGVAVGRVPCARTREQRRLGDELFATELAAEELAKQAVADVTLPRPADTPHEDAAALEAAEHHGTVVATGQSVAQRSVEA